MAGAAFTAPRSWLKAPSATWLDVDGLLAALDAEAWARAEPDQERHVRLDLHWAPGHRARGLDLEVCRAGDSVPAERRLANAEALLRLVTEDPGWAVLRVDLLRTLGDRTGAQHVVDTLGDSLGDLGAWLRRLIEENQPGAVELLAGRSLAAA